MSSEAMSLLRMEAEITPMQLQAEECPWGRGQEMGEGRPELSLVSKGLQVLGGKGMELSLTPSQRELSASKGG